MLMAIRAVVRQLGGGHVASACGIGLWHSVGTNEGLIDAWEDRDAAVAEACGDAWLGT